VQGAWSTVSVGLAATIVPRSETLIFIISAGVMGATPGHRSVGEATVRRLFGDVDL
jgi:hypothetical protein